MKNPFEYEAGHFRDTMGRVLSYEEAVAQFGDRAVWFTALWGEVKEKTSRLRLPPYPPRIFVSYRWDNEELVSWVETLATFVKDSGYEVILDKWNSFSGALDVPKYVSRIAECHYVIVVVTKEYCRIAKAPPEAFLFVGHPLKTTGSVEVDRKLSTDGWVADEYDLASRLSTTSLKLIMAIKEGDSLPEAAKPWRTVDFRHNSSVHQIQDALPPYVGVTLTEHENHSLVSILQLSQRIVVAMKNRESRATVDTMIGELEDLVGSIPENSSLRETQEVQSIAAALMMGQTFEPKSDTINNRD